MKPYGIYGGEMHLSFYRVFDALKYRLNPRGELFLVLPLDPYYYGFMQRFLPLLKPINAKVGT